MSSANIPEMIDLVFDLEGGVLPASHNFALWDALVRVAPELEEVQVGVLQLRTTNHGASVVLAKRAKLAIRIPKTTEQKTAAHLTGMQLDLEGTALVLGKSKVRELKPFPTLHAHIVTGNDDEIRFMMEIQSEIDEMGISGNLICGRRDTITNGKRAVHGYSLVVHDLKPEASLLLQCKGLGTDRQFGCGIFIPYKIITGLSED